MASDDWIDALERMDVVFADFATMDVLMARLDEVLGHPPSTEQVLQAQEIFQPQMMEAITQDLRVDRFVRRGKKVTQLRDRFGRFVTEGARNIADRLSRGAG